MNKDLAAFRLYQMDGIGKVKRKYLLDLFGSEEEIFRQDKRVIFSLPFLTHKDKAMWFRQKNFSECEQLLTFYKEKDIQFLSQYNCEYPAELRHIPDAPYGIFLRGNVPQKDRIRLAIVGTRECTSRGKEMATYFASQLSLSGFDIVSGMAMGIDHYAHVGALKENGSTFAVMGCGVDVCYPQSDLKTYNRIIEKGGIISEFLVGTQPKPQFFPMRNRIISGLCHGVLIIEARQKSGTLITADCALEQGKDVFAIPGRITDANSQGTNNLIKQGAIPVTEVSDITNFYQMDEVKKEVRMTDPEKKIMGCLSLEPKHIQCIVEEGMESFGETICVLNELEQRHLVKQVSKNYYILVMH